MGSERFQVSFFTNAGVDHGVDLKEKKGGIRMGPALCSRASSRSACSAVVLIEASKNMSVLVSARQISKDHDKPHANFLPGEHL